LLFHRVVVVLDSGLSALPVLCFSCLVLACAPPSVPGILILSSVLPAIVIRQKKSWRRKDGVYIYFEGAWFYFAPTLICRLKSFPRRPSSTCSDTTPPLRPHARAFLARLTHSFPPLLLALQTTRVSSSTPRVKSRVPPSPAPLPRSAPTFGRVSLLPLALSSKSVCSCVVHFKGKFLLAARSR
jgi:hypothetical protein